MFRYQRLLDRYQCLLDRYQRLLDRWLRGHRAVVAVEIIREELRFVGAHADYHPGLAPGLCQRIADITDDRLPRRGGQAVQRAPLFP